MGASLTTRRCVSDEGLRVVKLFRARAKVLGEKPKDMRVLRKEAPANSVPAAAVIRRVQALIGIIGRKGRVGGCKSQM